MTNEVDIEVLEQMLTGEDRLQIAGWCASAIQTQPSEEAMQEARAFISKEDVHAAVAQRVRNRFADSTLPDRFDDLLAQNLALMVRAQEAEDQSRIRQECLLVAVDKLNAADDQLKIETTARKRQAFIIRTQRLTLRRTTLWAIGFTCAGLVVGIAIGLAL